MYGKISYYYTNQLQHSNYTLSQNNSFNALGVLSVFKIRIQNIKFVEKLGIN